MIPDPRSVPVWRVDHDLPAIAPVHLSADALRTRFAHPPVWQPEVVQEPRFTQRAPAQAAVLLAIVPRGPQGSAPTVLLTQRTQHLSTHSGQIAFPGGKRDDTDPSLEATALRETHEEIGLHPRHVDILGSLPVYVTGTAFCVTPVVGLVQPGFELQPNADEVDDVFEVPLDFLMNPAHHRRHHFEWEGRQRQWFSMPYKESRPDAQGELEHIERFIWGATAGMLRNFYRFLAANPVP